MCWTDPPEASKRLIKNLCQQIVNEVKIMEKDGDLTSFDIPHVHQLIDHLYRPESCTEKK